MKRIKAWGLESCGELVDRGWIPGLSFPAPAGLSTAALFRVRSDARAARRRLLTEGPRWFRREGVKVVRVSVSW